MNIIQRNKLLSALVILLLLANITAMAIFWWQKMHAPNARSRNEVPGAAAFLIQRLALDSTQQIAFKQLQSQQQQKIFLGKEAVRMAKDHFFDLLDRDSVSEIELQAAASNAAAKQVALDRVTFDFFKSVQELCTPEQKIIFKDIIREALRIMGRPGAPPVKRNGRW